MTMNTRLRQIRLERGLSQERLAKKSRVSARTIYSIEHGFRCRMGTKRKLLQGLGIQFQFRDSVFTQHKARIVYE